MKARADRFTRVVVLVWVVAGVIIFTAGFRALTAIGLLSFFGSDVSPGICRPLALPAPADLAYEPKSKTLFIASNPAAGAGAIHALLDGQSKPVKLAGTPADFHPRAISIGYDAGGAPMLAVVDIKASGATSVEMYGVSFEGGAKLAYQSNVQGGLARRAQGIANLGNDRFYLTGNPVSGEFMAWADRWLVLSRSHLLFFNGTLFMDAVAGLSDPSGVAVSADGSRLYVVSRNERRLTAFSREPFSGTVAEVDSIALPMRPERVSMDANNVLWVAGMNRLPSLGGTSVVARVFLGANGAPESVEKVYAGDGIKQASAAVKAENRLFIGSGADDKFLGCDVK
jgi:hypothetical protein